MTASVVLRGDVATSLDASEKLRAGGIADAAAEPLTAGAAETTVEAGALSLLLGFDW